MEHSLHEVVVMGVLSMVLVACSGERPNNVDMKNGALPACSPSPNCVSSQCVDRRHLIQPMSFSDEADSAFARLKKILLSRSDVTLVAESREYLQAEFRTRLGFVDDSGFLLDRERRVIHLRSASRLGYYDLGKNRSRLEEIRRAFYATEKKQ
jgi:uncharacterized protein (DUF1499 family)